MEVIFEGYKVHNIDTDVGSIALLRKVVEEKLSLDPNFVSKLINDEDLALSWLDAIARNYSVDVARVRIHTDSGMVVEYGTSTVKAPKIATIHPSLTRVSRIDILRGNTIDQNSRELKIALEESNNVTSIVPTEDLYVFEGPVSSLSLQNSALIIHTDVDTVYLDDRVLNDVTTSLQVSTARTTKSSSSSRRKSRRKRRKSRKRKRRSTASAK